MALPPLWQTIAHLTYQALGMAGQEEEEDNGQVDTTKTLEAWAVTVTTR